MNERNLCRHRFSPLNPQSCELCGTDPMKGILDLQNMRDTAETLLTAWQKRAYEAEAQVAALTPLVEWIKCGHTRHCEGDEENGVPCDCGLEAAIAQAEAALKTGVTNT